MIATQHAPLWSCNAAGDAVDMLEVCPQGMGLAAELAKRVSQEGGAALVVDYGRDAPLPGLAAGHSGAQLCAHAVATRAC